LNECDDALHLTCHRDGICYCKKSKEMEYYYYRGKCFKAFDYDGYCEDDTYCRTIQQQTVCISNKCVCPGGKNWNGSQCGKLKKNYLKWKLVLFINIFFFFSTKSKKKKAMFRLGCLTLWKGAQTLL
jgi:hypothetical protein